MISEKKSRKKTVILEFKKDISKKKKVNFFIGYSELECFALSFKKLAL
jgi:hypothetical protein